MKITPMLTLYTAIHAQRLIPTSLFKTIASTCMHACMYFRRKVIKIAQNSDRGQCDQTFCEKIAQFCQKKSPKSEPY
jgi:hypothetical protein